MKPRLNCGRSELLLPLYYVDVPLLNHDGPVEDKLLLRVRDFQKDHRKEFSVERMAKLLDGKIGANSNSRR